ncbi:MAG: hypothetical protein ABI821_07105 [Pseudomonadota bacterium]
MKHGLGIGFALLLSAAAAAADPPKPALTKPLVAKPLDLRIGDVRKYMTPKEYLAAISAPDADKSEVVVEGARGAQKLRSELPVPGGLGSLWFAATNPLQSWRIFLPNVNAPPAGPVYDPVPPPIFRWGP